MRRPLPSLKQGDAVDLKQVTKEQQFTQPPARYTEATLIRAMEEKGIGRPSTYAPTISTILSRNYVVKEGRYLRPTNLGIVVTEMMEEYFRNIVDLKFTANMETDLDKIEAGKMAWKDVLREYYKDFDANLNNAEIQLEGKHLKVPDEESDEVCPNCGRKLVYKNGRFGRFLACPGYPECSFTMPIVVEMPGKCPACGGPAKRETNTMPQWAGSSWYFLRYVDNKNDKELVSKEKADKYLPVDMYIGGVEHAVLHLLYSRFYTKFLYDIGAIDFDEPFHKLFNQGMITGKNGIKMSKSKGNVVSPDDLVRDYGCDSLRMYELFVGPPELDAEWDESGIDGVHRFLTRFYKLIMDQKDKGVEADKELLKVRHKLIYDITTRLNNFSLNTVVSGFMEYTNTLTAMAKKSGVDKETLETAIVLLAPFAPHIAEELWEAMGHEDSVFAQTWPTYDEEAMKEDEVEIVVQINGKVKGKLVIGAEEDKDSVLAKAKEVLGDKLNGNIVKEIYVPGRIVNIVQK